MQTEDLESLARTFVDESVRVQADDRVKIDFAGPNSSELAKACAERVRVLGATVLMEDVGHASIYQKFQGQSDDVLTRAGEQTLQNAQSVSGLIRIDDPDDEARSQFSQEEMIRYRELVRGPMKEFVMGAQDLNWLVVRAPTADFAKAHGMELDRFERYYMGANTSISPSIEPQFEPLKQIMGREMTVRIEGPGTDLSFITLGGGQSKSCIGFRNRPDGEVFTAPKLGTLNGHALFGRTRYLGQAFEQVFLRYQDGVVVEAKAENDERTLALNKILDKDGARIACEFGIGLNPVIEEPVGFILYDEKIARSWHMATGGAHGAADNGSRSKTVHWDQVQQQAARFGGGRMWFDDQLVRVDGDFVLPELEHLNPDRLLG